jgi:hypothetical protein
VLQLHLAEKGAKIEERAGVGKADQVKKRKRDFSCDDIDRLDPLHWAYDFDQIMHGSWWDRLDGKEANVVQEGGRIRVRFGPEPIPTPA